MPQGPASLKRPQEELKPSASAPTPIQETCAALSPRKPAGFQETEDYAQFKACILHKTGIDLNLYKQPQMYRRLQHMVERANVGNFMEYYDVLKRDDDEFAAFLDRMTINVSALFRNPEKWQELRDSVLTPMLANRRALKVWSAGCSNGAEPYTLAILLDQLAPGGRHTIHATDLDPKILAKAKEGAFTRADVKHMDAATRDRYLLRLPVRKGQDAQIQPVYQIKPEIRARVRFRAHNLLADAFDADYDLICCRNVVIYFTEEAKDRLFARFHQALTPGGVLFVGGTERIYNYREIGFEAPQALIYRKAA